MNGWHSGDKDGLKLILLYIKQSFLERHYLPPSGGTWHTKDQVNEQKDKDKDGK